MNEGGEDEFEGDPEDFWIALGEFLDNHQEDIGVVIRAHAENMRASLQQKGRITLAVFALLGVIIGVIAYLALQGVVGGESVAFLVGAIVGYLFSFMRRYIIGVEA